VQTGTLTGAVKSNAGIPLAGVLVTATSASLQGERATRTDVNGNYALPHLPPGTYHVRFSKTDLLPVEVTTLVPLGTTAIADATLADIPAEYVRVEASTPPAVTSIQTSANTTAADERASMGRTPFLIAELVSGVTTNTPAPNQLTIRRLRVRQRVLIDGALVNDNPLGTASTICISKMRLASFRCSARDSAEYGRFSGGVEHHHQERRQYARRELPHHVHAAVLDSGDTVRARGEHRARQADGLESVHHEHALPFQRNHARRTADEKPRVVLRRRPFRELLHRRHHAGNGRRLHEDQRQQTV
jgi:hypothetical protein